MINTPCPPELRDAWARVFAHAWKHDNKDFLRKLNKDPRQTISQIANSRSPEKLAEACQTILKYVDAPDSEEGFLALPPLPESLTTGDLSEEQLYGYAKQDGLYGILRVC
ncbi:MULTISPECIES: hypothetical protein [unclassified Microcoleus]|uniref:hypothetical protein n=1 Tax=unclassified Microcoleus TaxID=2642155 RepID=UPI002FD689BE